MANVLVDETSLQGIADAIRSKNGETATYKPSEMPAAIEAIGSGTVDLSMVSTFRYSFPNEITNFEANIPNVTSLKSAFSDRNANHNLKNITLRVTNKLKAVTLMLYHTRVTSVEFIGDMSAVTDYDNAFCGDDYQLKSIKGLDFTSTTNVRSMFTGKYVLETITIVPNTLKLSITIPSQALSDESIQNIIDGLADMTDGTAQTLTLHSTVKEKLTEEQIASATAKNWTIA